MLTTYYFLFIELNNFYDAQIRKYVQILIIPYMPFEDYHTSAFTLWHTLLSPMSPATPDEAIYHCLFRVMLGYEFKALIPF